MKKKRLLPTLSLSVLALGLSLTSNISTASNPCNYHSSRFTLPALGSKKLQGYFKQLGYRFKESELQKIMKSYRNSLINTDAYNKLLTDLASKTGSIEEVEDQIFANLLLIKRRGYFDWLEPNDIALMGKLSPIDKDQLLTNLSALLKRLEKDPTLEPQLAYEMDPSLQSIVLELRRSIPIKEVGADSGQKKVVIGIDLGGTKMAFGAVDAGNVPLEKKLVKKTEVPTFTEEINGPITDEKMREKFLERMAKQVSDMVKEVKEEGYEVELTIGLGSPGLLKDGVITPGTVQQLGSAFYGYNIEKGLESYLKKFNPNISLKVKNDALAQMAFGVHGLSIDSSLGKQIVGKKVAYFGPGSSLGGGFAHVRQNQSGLELEFFTDGHIFDIQIDGKDAHDLISARFFAWRSKEKYGVELTGKEIASNLDKYGEIVEEAGTNMGKVLEKIYRGEFSKREGSTPWSKEDFLSVKGVKTFILGGSIATKGEFGKIVQRKAMEYLALVGIDDVVLLPPSSSSESAGMIGAAAFAGLKNLVPR